MVDDVSIRREDEVVMHKGAGVSAGGQADGAFGVEDVFTFCSAEAPFEFGEVVIIGGVDDCEFGLGEWDFAECAAEAETTIPERNEDKQIFNPWRDVDVNPDDSPTLVKSE